MYFIGVRISSFAPFFHTPPPSFHVQATMPADMKLNKRTVLKTLKKAVADGDLVEIEDFYKLSDKDIGDIYKAEAATEVEYYAPVCGCNGRTYASECEAHAEGMSISSKGACEDLTVSQKNRCEPHGCVDPLTGECTGFASCLADPCSNLEKACRPGTICQTNTCGACRAICTPLSEQTDLHVQSPRIQPPLRPAMCDDSKILIAGGEGDPKADSGGGQGGVALRVHGNTSVQIKGATLMGGTGSIQGLAMEIVQAVVTVHSAVIDGGVLVAKGGTMNVHGGSFMNGDIEITEDSMVTFFGCFDNVKQYDVDGFEGWSFKFSGDNPSIWARVHEGGKITFDETGQECTGIPLPCQGDNECLDHKTGLCAKVYPCDINPCSLVECPRGQECRTNDCGGCNAECHLSDSPQESLFLGP